MALIQWSALANQAKGKLNGSVFQGSPYGQILKNQSTPAKLSRKLIPQQFARQHRKYNVWRNLTTNERKAWETAAASHPVLNRFGDSVYLPAFQFFLHWSRSWHGTDAQLAAGFPKGTGDMGIQKFHCKKAKPTYFDLEGINPGADVDYIAWWYTQEQPPYVKYRKYGWIYRKQDVPPSGVARHYVHNFEYPHTYHTGNVLYMRFQPINSINNYHGREIIQRVTIV